MALEEEIEAKLLECFKTIQDKSLSKELLEKGKLTFRTYGLSGKTMTITLNMTLE